MMDLNEKELIEQARMMGVPAHEFAAKFIARDLVEATLTAVRKVVKLKENQEGKLIDQLNEDIKELVTAAVAVIAAAGTSAITCTMKSYMGTGKSLRVVLDTDGDDPQRHALTDRVNNRVLLVLAPDEYYSALDSNKPQKDQADLPLDDKEENPLGALQQLAESVAALSSEPISPYELAFIHVTNGGAITAKAIQEAAGVKRKEVTDIILALASNGIISEPDDEGLRTLIPADQRPKTVTEEKHGPGAVAEPAPFDENQYADAVLLVQRERKISNSFLRSNFAVTEDVADAMIFRMEQDGVVSEVNDLGGRAIYD
jgi:DNA segregation ATPase FtsK/SpoIIIE and related proteins